MKLPLMVLLAWGCPQLVGAQAPARLGVGAVYDVPDARVAPNLPLPDALAPQVVPLLLQDCAIDLTPFPRPENPREAEELARYLDDLVEKGPALALVRDLVASQVELAAAAHRYKLEHPDSPGHVAPGRFVAEVAARRAYQGYASLMRRSALTWLGLLNPERHAATCARLATHPKSALRCPADAGGSPPVE